MNKLISIIYLILILVSVNTKFVKSQDTQYYDEFYKVLNDLVRIQVTNVSVIRCETEPVFKSMWGNTPNLDNDTISPPPPPPPGFMYYDTSYFGFLKRWNRLDSEDAHYMFNAIDSSKTLKIDSSKVLLPIINKEELSEIFNVEDIYDGYNRIRSIYGTSCFIIVSTPIFNIDYTKVLISIDYCCGPTWGEGYQYLLEKRNGLWWLIDWNETWVS